MDTPQIIDITNPYSGKGGELYVLGQDGLPFQVKRVFWITDVPNQWHVRGDHAHRTCHQIFIPVQGRFCTYVLGKNTEQDFWLHEDKHKALWIPPMHWMSLNSFIVGTVCMVLCSEEYREDSYIRDFDAFKKIIGTVQPGRKISNGE
ncbi:MAG: WxcM-like domain-containing protein [Gammaproteobacteria bacterium]|nr:WxcM-like domain-containing protein [Desulfobacterales bacterium]NIR27629.1 WxcM-like domain-containing protein [Gammaproteobacteria bacterium]NIW34455.1 WxcM-like domain-containing protein [Candidatus Bathyarchaeota archaeon]